jgi:choline dehydrogenase-like flavoprotein
MVAHYEAAERLLVITGPGRDAPQLPAGHVYRQRELPADWNTVATAAARRRQGLVALPLADGPSFLLARRSVAFSSYANIVRGLLRSPLFALRTGCTALRLEWSKSHRRIVSVLYQEKSTGFRHNLEAPAFVLACGALRSTKLLFDSSCRDFPDGLGNEFGNLGRFLHDHAREWWSVELDKPIRRMAPAAYLTRRPFGESEPLMSTSWAVGLGATRRDKMLSLLPSASNKVGVNVFGSMVPSEANYVRPHPSLKDEFGLPQLEVHLKYDSQTLDNIVSARATFTELLDEAGYPCRLDPVDPQLTPGNSVHYGGTARMHREAKYGVCDQWSRVFGIPNLVVADASTFTTSSEKNPTLTAMALARRAAERLAHDLRG